MSNFTEVADLNKVFKMETTTTNNIDWDVVKHQLKIISSEYNELLKAINEKDITELKDGIGDVLVTTYGLGHRISIDCDLLMKNISDSNFSKICETYDIAQETLSYYTDLGVECYIEDSELKGNKVYIVKSSKDQIVNINGEDKDFVKGKFLKSIYWKEPDLNVEV